MPDRPAPSSERRPTGAQARSAIVENPVWYHTIELSDGIATPGRVDMRPVAGRALPDSLAGKRGLDVGTFDGFWAFAMEERGAEVVAIDVDKLEAAEWPPLSRERLARERDRLGMELGRGFRLAAEARGSGARRVVGDVYDLDAAAIGGSVDFAFSGAILLHLRNPVGALERIHSVLAPGGELRIIEPFSWRLTLLSPRAPAATFRAASSDFCWWSANLACLAHWLRAAGFVEIRRLGIVRPPAEPAMRQAYAILAARRA